MFLLLNLSLRLIAMISHSALLKGIQRVCHYSTKSQDKPNFLVVSSVGNPEPQYSNTRHNAGHLVINHLQHTPFRSHSELSSTNIQFATSKLHSNLVFTKSLTYMNISGKSIIPSWNYFYKKYQDDYNVNFLVLHDELGKDLGKYQLRYGGNEISSRGHNGLKSIVEHNKHGFKFFRLGVGISRPQSRKADDVAKYVLNTFPEEEVNTILFDVLPQISETIENFVQKK